MNIITKTLPADYNNFLYSCDHEGSLLRHAKGFDKMKDMMFSEYEGCKENVAWDFGDAIEAIQIDDPRFHPSTVSPTKSVPMLQMEAAIEHRKDIAHLIIGMNESNHPLKHWRFGNITQKIIKELNEKHGGNIAYIAWAGKLVAVDYHGQVMHRMFNIHGRLAVNSRVPDAKRRRTNNQIKLKTQLSPLMGDCILMCKAHIHKLINCHPDRELYITGDGQKTKQGYTQGEEVDQTASFIHESNRYYVAVGSFLRLYGENIAGYAERMEMQPIELGFQIARYRDRRLVGVDPIYLD